MEKVLLVARLGKFFSDFELSDIQILQDMGYEVWCVGNYDGDNHKLDHTGVKKVHLNFQRSPLSMENIREYKKLIQIIRENDFKLMHCHMPIGGVFARLAAHKCGLHPIIYTAHGFQFCKGGPMRDWLLFYPVEKFLSRYTDVLITINQEDYELASKKFHAKKVIHLNGVGVDVQKYHNTPSKRKELCEEIEVPEDSYLLLSVGELSKRKNHEVVIRGLAQYLNEHTMNGQREECHYLIAGVGALDTYLRELVISLGVEEYVHFLGWRDDIARLCKSVDVFVFPSHREGLPVALMEAMAAGLPVIASKARGNTELVENGVNGILCEKNVAEEYAEAMAWIKTMDPICMQNRSLEIMQKYDIADVREEMRKIYKELIEE